MDPVTPALTDTPNIDRDAVRPFVDTWVDEPGFPRCVCCGRPEQADPVADAAAALGDWLANAPTERRADLAAPEAAPLVARLHAAHQARAATERADPCPECGKGDGRHDEACLRFGVSEQADPVADAERERAAASVEVVDLIANADCYCTPGDPTCEDWRGTRHRWETIAAAVALHPEKVARLHAAHQALAAARKERADPAADAEAAWAAARKALVEAEEAPFGRSKIGWAKKVVAADRAVHATYQALAAGRKERDERLRVTDEEVRAIAADVWVNASISDRALVRDVLKAARRLAADGRLDLPSEEA